MPTFTAQFTVPADVVVTVEGDTEELAMAAASTMLADRLRTLSVNTNGVSVSLNLSALSAANASRELTRERVQFHGARGAFKVLLDGVFVGRVVGTPHAWRAVPVLAERSEHAVAMADQGFYRGTRTDMACWLLDWQGLPLPLAQTIVQGGEIDPKHRRQVDDFLATMRKAAQS